MSVGVGVSLTGELPWCSPVGRGRSLCVSVGVGVSLTGDLPWCSLVCRDRLLCVSVHVVCVPDQ